MIGCISSKQQVQGSAVLRRVNAWVIIRDTDAEERFLTAVFRGC
jgi:hypothetical protein